jgi:hypothetical protein
MMGNPVNMRPQGVQVPQDQLSPGTGEPFTVTQFCEAKSFAATYADDHGKLHTSILLRIGGQWHIAPNGENFAATLKSLKRDGRLSNNLEAKYQESQPSLALGGGVPAADAVDPIDDEAGNGP